MAQKNSFTDETKSINKKYLKFYINNIVLVSIAAIVSSILIFFIVLYINQNAIFLQTSKFIFNNVTYFVFIIGLISYSILSVTLSNVVILFSLSQHSMVTKVMGYSLLVNSIIGFLLSRWFDYYFAVIGLLIGTIFFCLATSYNVIKVLNNLDYYLYSSS